MEDIQKLTANLSDEQVEELRSAKHPPSVRSWGDQEMAARKIRREQAQVALQAMFEAEQVKDKANKAFVLVADKVLGNLPEYSLEWRKVTATQAVHIYTIEMNDMDKLQEEVTGANGNKELHYPKKLIRKVDVGVQPTQLNSSGKPGKGATKAQGGGSRLVVVKVERGNEIVLIGKYPNGADAERDIQAQHASYFPNKPYISASEGTSYSASRQMAANGYRIEDEQGNVKYYPAKR